jgi:hypothetical protein
MNGIRSIKIKLTASIGSFLVPENQIDERIS